MKASKTLPDARNKARTMEGRQLEWRKLRPFRKLGRLEDLYAWMMDKAKVTKKAARHTATGWPHGEKR